MVVGHEFFNNMTAGAVAEMMTKAGEDSSTSAWIAIR
jgi:hypothetical protein